MNNECYQPASQIKKRFSVCNNTLKRWSAAGRIQTRTSPSGKHFFNIRDVEWGKGDIGRIYRLCHALDKLTSKATQKEVRHAKRYSYKKAMGRLRKRIRCLIDDIQWKLARWLCQNHRVVLIPKFETQNMVRRSLRQIGSKTARAMCTWAHYRFRTRLLDKAREFPLCKIIVCDEAYTSKTCGCCGLLNQTLGASKCFRCDVCEYEADRDANGARNILFRYLSINSL